MLPVLTAIISLLIIVHIFFQDRFIFQREKLSKDHIYSFNQYFEEHFIEVESGIQINALWFKPDGTSKGLVIYFHGNAGSLDRWGYVAQDFTNLGYELLICDYRGYGKSDGKPTEKNLYQDAEFMYTWATSKTNQPIVIYGRSLGSAVAAYLAAKIQPELLILETPFDELRGVLSGILFNVTKVFPLNYKFPTRNYLEKVEGKKVIFHGTNDHVVPLKSALRLKDVLREQDEFIIVAGANHDNIGTYQIYQSKLRQLLK